MTPTSPAPILSMTRSGRFVDLLRPDFTALDIGEDIARPLARIARFAGATSGARAWSVAQHSVIGADALLAETGDPTTALAFLIHNVHEVLIGDIPRPAAQALAYHVGAALRLTLGAPAAAVAERDAGGNLFAVALAALSASLDRAIRARAGLPPALPPSLAAAVAWMDERMLSTELADQMAQPRAKREVVATAWGSIAGVTPIRRKGRLAPWCETIAAREWLTRFDLWRIRPEAKVIV